MKLPSTGSMTTFRSIRFYLGSWIPKILAAVHKLRNVRGEGRANASIQNSHFSYEKQAKIDAENGYFSVTQFMDWSATCLTIIYVDGW